MLSPRTSSNGCNKIILLFFLINGAVWAAIPKWAYIIFTIVVLAAGGFGYGFFYQLNENSKLKDVGKTYNPDNHCRGCLSLFIQ